MSDAESSGKKIRLKKPKPWHDKRDGSDLLTEIVAWIQDYIYLPKGASAAIAVWVVATWLVADLYFAPLLSLVSPTKRCGKSNLLHLLQWIVYRGFLTSGVGVTPAVVFRINESEHPTLLIDEAENLRKQAGGSEIVSLLNAGYRQGQTVQRCLGQDGDFQVRSYDAFGFRVIALIGKPWDTLVDRSITIPIQRKPRDHEVRRFNGKSIDRHGQILAQKIARWVQDNRSRMLGAETNAPRPPSLNDRECDNWSALFAVAQVAGGEWPDLVQEAALLLQAEPGEDGDWGERLIHDVRAIFESRGYPEALMSGDLASALCGFETSPWGDIRGRGLTPRGLASRLKPFGIVPKQARTASGKKIRGYWRSDLEPVFERYPPRVLGQVGQRPLSEDSARPTSTRDMGLNRDGENPIETKQVPLVPLTSPCAAGLVFQLVQEG